MERTVLGISTSPRAGGNSDLLLKEALRGAESVGGRTEYVALRGLSIAPCYSCGRCRTLGRCQVQDDFQPLFEKMLAADRLVVALPIYFMAVPAQAKALIDRCQCLWSRKYVLKEPLYPAGRRDRRGLVMAVGGSTSRKMFDSVRLTMKYYLDVLEVGYFANLFVNRVDGKGDIARHPTALREAYHLGAALASFSGPMPEGSIDVFLSGEAGGSPAGRPSRREGG
jgi:multimeric flavodoxin WrbA